MAVTQRRGKGNIMVLFDEMVGCLSGIVRQLEKATRS
jgi:hypothetical protein